MFIQIGDSVVRSDFGEVVGISHSGEVKVQWEDGSADIVPHHALNWVLGEWHLQS